MLKLVAEQILEEHDIVFRVGEGTVEALIRCGGYDQDLGARPMRRTIQSLIEGPVSKMILGGEANRGDTMTVVGRGDDLSLTIDKM
jgi:ATP-dependent Clp protease ATP-binding subunit ClpA